MWIFKRSEALDNFVVLGPNVLAEITLAAVYSECRKGIFFRPDKFFFFSRSFRFENGFYETHVKRTVATGRATKKNIGNISNRYIFVHI